MQRVPTNATRFVCFLAVAVLRLDAAEPGTKLWEFQSAGRIYSSPAIGPDGAVYFGSLDRQVYALNPDGSRRWLYTTRGGVASSPAIGAVRVNADTGAVLRVTGLPGETYLIQVSTDLVHWQVLGAATTAEGAADFQDPALPAAGQRFYRAVWP